MDERIQQALDGEVPRSRLEPEAEQELSAVEDAIRGALEGLRLEAPRDCVEEVMARIAAVEAPRRAGRARAAAGWLWRPRTVSLRLRPAYGILAAAALAAALLVPRAATREAPAPARVFVAFRLDARGASRVELAGDFTAWKPTYALHESAPGVWSVVVPLEPGVHDYAFVVDGERWTPDPLAPTVADGFGGVNSRMAVLPPLRGRAS